MTHLLDLWVVFRLQGYRCFILCISVKNMSIGPFMSVLSMNESFWESYRYKRLNILCFGIRLFEKCFWFSRSASVRLSLAIPYVRCLAAFSSSLNYPIKKENTFTCYTLPPILPTNDANSVDELVLLQVVAIWAFIVNIVVKKHFATMLWIKSVFSFHVTFEYLRPTAPLSPIHSNTKIFTSCATP